MCSGSKRKPTHLGFIDELQKEDCFCYDLSILLELFTSNDLIGFKRAIEEEGREVVWLGNWLKKDGT
ncbi:conserved hypothetical protein [Ricinus communis]|uniref:Uncharacterized protein n=1 Tax=Ricinus communis TaxID=3988 RepID=B9SK60_RICCO|nr:conserved hypothetical protein [Ricinus communis]EEF36003.1 conserved hypothetical protein [Ricinus communis]